VELGKDTKALLKHDLYKRFEKLASAYDADKNKKKLTKEIDKLMTMVHKEGVYQQFRKFVLEKKLMTGNLCFRCFTSQD